VLHGVFAGTRGRRLVAARPDLGTGADAQPTAAVGASFGYWHVETPTGGDHRLTTNFTIVPPLNEPRPLRR
jgi:hypothetical protein